MSTLSVIILVIGIVAMAAILFSIWRKERSKKLRSRFGPEYEEAVSEYGSRDKAEQSLVTRQKRMEKIPIQPLSATERDRFAEEWIRVQAMFVDDPAGAIHGADRLVCDAMRARGYPMTDFDRRAEDLSVDHPQVVKNYRAGHDIALRAERKEATTEDLRRGLVYYRDLFEELLETHVSGTRR
jgi:FtsZ-interacting cell division protein ZipA